MTYALRRPILRAVPFDMDSFRALIRAERESRVGGREKFAERIGIAKSTVQNIEVGPDIPGIDTVARIIEGMPGLTLSAFFARIEVLLAGVKQNHDRSTPAKAVEGGEAPTLPRAEVPSDIREENERLREERDRERQLADNLAKVLSRDHDKYEKQIQALDRKVADLSARIPRRRRKNRKNRPGPAP